MNRQLVGEPAVSAFLRSVLRNLADISRTKPSYYTYLYYDPAQDLKKLKEKLVFFQGLVVDGEAKRLDAPSVDEWMDDIDDLLYDVEDIFDDIKILWRDLQVSVNYPLLKKFSDDINSRFEKILARAEELGEKSVKLKLETGHAFPGGSKVTQRTRETSSVVDISEIHGREDDKNVLVKRLLEVNGGKGKKNYDVLCIVGMGGLGKTTLAQLVFNDLEVVKHFDVKSWVCISIVFEIARATKGLIEYSDGRCSLGDQSLAVLQRRLKEMVANKRFLFVLDDVWSSSEWGEMKAPFSSCANGSKILVTTRKTKIAHALGNKHPHQLQKLNHEKCMEIFRGKAFEDDEAEEEKVNLMEKIVRACGGVPLVVKVIGSMLQVAKVEKWRAVSENMGASWANENDEIHPAIRFSYYDLPAYLKRCFQYLAVFPPDHKFNQYKVVSLWIADGLVEEEEGRMAKDIGIEYYDELKVRSLIQENDMMHDIVHHLATVVSNKICYKKEPLASLRHAYVVRPDAMHCEFLAEALGLRTLIIENADNDDNLRNIISSFKMLRTLFIDPWSDRITLSLGESFIDHLTHIRYLNIYGSDIKHLWNPSCMSNNLQFLDLSSCEYLEKLVDRANLILLDSSISSLPESICQLSQLQVLNLSFCRKLKELPQDIGALRSLLTLDLSFCRISSLTESFCALSQLQVLNLTFCRNLIQLPEDIGNLRSLRTLDLKENFISSLPESICYLSQLQVLDLQNCPNLIQLPKDIGNLKSLQTLDLGLTSISSLPESLCTLSQLQVLNLMGCCNLIQLPKDIGTLRSLRTLDLSAISISSLPESICSLSQLQVLHLEGCENLIQLPKDIGNLRSLQRLALKETKLRLPESIVNVTGLRDLLLDEDQQLPLHIGQLARLKKLPRYNVGKEEGRHLGELNLMNMLQGPLVIASMENIGGVEEAKKADLKSKKNLKQLTFIWSEPGNDPETEMKILEALEPHHAIESLNFSNYGGDKFPTWIMPSNFCFSNLTSLSMKGLNKIREMIDMEFVSLQDLTIESCPKLKEILMATPRLTELYTRECGELEAASVHLLPSLSDKAGLHSILSHLKILECAYNIFEYFFDKLRTANSKWDNLVFIELSGGGTRVASLPVGWPSIMASLESIRISKIEEGKFQFLPDSDQSAFPPSLRRLSINGCEIKEMVPHHSYSIASDGTVNP